MQASSLQIVSAALFALAIVHTFSTRAFERLAHTQPAHAGMWHLLGEVEIVFGFWAMLLGLYLFLVEGSGVALAYLDGRDFTEPLFVFAIMVVAASRPVLQFAARCTRAAARLLPLPENAAFFFVSLSLVPLLGSLITEPAAMTLAALMLRDRFFAAGLSERAKYAALGVLFVNVSIGGTATAYAAPPVLMVAQQWAWDLSFMLGNFGWKAALATCVNAFAVTAMIASELARLPPSADERVPTIAVPAPFIALHLLLLVGIVAFNHHPVMFLSFALTFLGVATAYPQHQDRIVLREGLLVAFFLAGLVVLGGQQSWWLEPLLMRMSADAVFVGAAALTAITDNAALTYLGSQVEGLDDAFKYALVAGAVTGGGLTVIANAPNPAGMSILRGHFEDESVNPLWLFAAALPPTLVAALAFRFL